MENIRDVFHIEISFSLPLKIFVFSVLFFCSFRKENKEKKWHKHNNPSPKKASPGTKEKSSESFEKNPVVITKKEPKSLVILFSF